MASPTERPLYNDGAESRDRSLHPPAATSLGDADAARWARLEALFHEALQHPAIDRPEFLARACAGDDDLRREVEQLVACDDQPDAALDVPILAGSPEGQTSLVGRRVGPYEVTALLGVGGMGRVYRARDEALGRDVALKTLPPEFGHDERRLAQLRREARALAALNHPGVAAIYGLVEAGDVVGLVLELVVGEPLRGPLPVDVALERAEQVSEALRAAHERGLVHRDLKPDNVTVTPEGRVKLLDFGLATVLAVSADAGVTGRTPAGPPVDSVTGSIAGTPGYMSPEQVRGEAVDQRTDVWAFGCLLFELLTGCRAFPGGTIPEIVANVLGRAPDWHALPAGTPSAIRHLLRHCLAQDPNVRAPAIADVQARISAVRVKRTRRRVALARLRRPRVALAFAASLVVAAGFGAWRFVRDGEVRWVREEAVPQVHRMIEAGDMKGAFRLLRRAESILPQDPTLRQLHESAALPLSFSTTPPGADVWGTNYDPEDEDWRWLGVTPFTTRDLLPGFYRVRIVKPGYETVLGTAEVRAGNVETFDLDPAGSLPAGMVRVPGGLVDAPWIGTAHLAPFLIDRFEVTNREYKAFVDAGGYATPAYWPREVVEAGGALTWEAAMSRFKDSTGRSGPATWAQGTYPPGRGDLPVGGVSWYEAAAYAAFVGKQLPTVLQWHRAASPGWFVEIAERSNFGGTGPAPVGSFHGIGAFGTYDMAGNVREWCWNDDGEGRRYLRGGAWNQADWTFAAPDVRPPLERGPENGLRCVRHDVQAEADLRRPRPASRVALRQEPRLSDEAFQSYASTLGYDPGELAAKVEAVDEDGPMWSRELVSFRAAYGDERVLAYLYLPKNRPRPLQAIVYANPGMALRLPAVECGEERLFDFVVKAGRAFLHPVLKGYYQRRYNGPPAGPNDARDRLVLESKDFRRAIDYLAARADIDPTRIGVFGYSRGSVMLPVLAVGEERLKAAVLVSVGLPTMVAITPEHYLDFLARYRVPTLLADGRSDFVFPADTSQRPMLEAMGTPSADKRLLQWEGSHGDIGRNYPTIVRETLAWFDQYLGPVR